MDGKYIPSKYTAFINFFNAALYRYGWITSALLLALAYTIPQYFFWLVLFFLIPLFVNTEHCKWWQGFIWGLLFYFIHFVYIAILLYERAYGQLRLICYPILVGYMALYSGIWFIVSHKISSYVHNKYPWIITTWLYFSGMQLYSLWIFGVLEGYPFALPIIPLANYSQTLYAVRYIGAYNTTLLFISWQYICAQWIKNYDQRLRFFAFFSVLLFAFGFIITKQESKMPQWAKQWIWVPINNSNFFSKQYPLDLAQEITYLLQRGAEQYKNRAIYFVLPESAFPFCLTPEYLKLWQATLDDNMQQCIIGTHMNSKKSSKNCIFQFDSRRIIQTYEKNHSVIFTERVPSYLKKYCFFNNLFGGKTDRSNNKNNIMNDKRNTSNCNHNSVFLHKYHIMICSELFFNGFLPLSKNDIPTIVLYNESWFSLNYIKILMLNYAQLIAQNFQKELLLIGHCHGLFISKTGRAQALFAVA